MKKRQEIAFISFSNIAVAIFAGGVLKLMLDDNHKTQSVGAMIFGLIFLSLVLFLAKRVESV